MSKLESLPSQTQQQYCFGRSVSQISQTYRPDTINRLSALCNGEHPPLIAIGHQLSYGDSCLSPYTVDTTHLDRWLNFDESNHQLTLEPGVCFNDFFRYPLAVMPAVVPGTLQASLGGAIANDVHGKNQPSYGCFGHHIQWIDLCIDGGYQRVSPNTYPELFYATIGGLGLTGIIKQFAMTTIPRISQIETRHQLFDNLTEAVLTLQTQTGDVPYQAIWADLLHGQRAVLIQGQAIAGESLEPRRRSIVEKFNAILPRRLPVSLIRRYSLKLFNRWVWQRYRQHQQPRIERFQQFNNPLDAMPHWQAAYGPRGMMQCQWVIPHQNVTIFIKEYQRLLKQQQATPALAVIKAFSQPGLGLLSFAKPGITFAVDFYESNNHRQLINNLHALILAAEGRVYLAKDKLLSQTHFEAMYPQHVAFKSLLANHQLDRKFQSCLSQRLGITP